VVVVDWLKLDSGYRGNAPRVAERVARRLRRELREVRKTDCGRCGSQVRRGARSRGDEDSGWSGRYRGETGGKDADSGSQENGDATSPRDFEFQPSLVGADTFRLWKWLRSRSMVEDKRGRGKWGDSESTKVFSLFTSHCHESFRTIPSSQEKAEGESEAFRSTSLVKGEA